MIPGSHLGTIAQLWLGLRPLGLLLCLEVHVTHIHQLRHTGPWPSSRMQMCGLRHRDVSRYGITDHWTSHSRPLGLCSDHPSGCIPDHLLGSSHDVQMRTCSRSSTTSLILLDVASAGMLLSSSPTACARWYLATSGSWECPNASRCIWGHYS